ncbi:hypothetical protein HHK36_010082 [Tetracentron sinense]|uniref:J domain-containing protein required for chloroplast accumulation response 1 n=1 Tax=Tetracentron sinense TaxID=13715 RepID=A0A835DLY2_TETSI|nr:hypothetical protein HHK36_010082 [Tetracentron sinense]
MERFSHRDHILLGYSPQRSSGNPSSSSKTTSRNSDVDFRDVFGGPPRRFSIHDSRQSLGGTVDSYALRGEDETLSPRNPWTALREKPVFGEDGLNQRRYRSDEFFDDIFRGDESSSSTPRKTDHDPFSSTLSSRILSPVRLSPPNSEPFGGSILGAQFSLSARSAKGMDFQAFTTSNQSPYRNMDAASTAVGFPSSPSASLSRASNQVVQGQDDSRNDVRPSYRQSPLSHEFSLSSKAPLKTTKCDEQDTRGTRKKDLSGLEVDSNCSQFHFSIYKWASKGVPLVMPLRGGYSLSSKEGGNNDRDSSSNGRDKIESIVSELPAPVMQGVEFPTLNDSTSETNKSSRMEYEKQDHISLFNTITRDRLDSSQITEEVVPAGPESKPLNNLQSTIIEVSSNLLPHTAGNGTKPRHGVSDALFDISLCRVTGEEISVSMQEAGKPELKPLPSLFYDKIDEQGQDKMAGQATENEGVVKSLDTSSGNVDGGKKVKKHDGKRIISNLAEEANISLQGSHNNPEEKLVGNKVKGKVKEFIKIFNQEVPSKPKTNVFTRSRSFRWKERGACKAENEACVYETRAVEKEKMTNVNKKKTLTVAPIMVDKFLRQSEEPHFGLSTGIRKIYDTSSEQNVSASSSESVPRCFEAAVGIIDESHCENFQGTYLIEELPHDQNNQTQTDEHHEEIQISDARIRRWSNGKEGNIRSLLSTLQYVLWPESGWKPVPLVDIIEGNAVKRAYQKALLCLHPDKLQQKGAASHQKYIAQKVFEILQLNIEYSDITKAAAI